MKYLLTVTVSALIAVSCASMKTTGTSDETISGVAKIYKIGGTSPAISANVRLYKVNDTTRVPQYQTLTDNKGSFKLETVPDGTYNLLVSQDSFVAYQDSIVVAGKQSTIANDTLELFGSVIGYIRLQAPDDPRRVIINMPGTGLYANVDANNRFSISGLATGNYTLSLAPTNLVDYTPTFVSMIAQGGRTDTLDTIEVIYNGIPLVGKFYADYDSLQGIARLRWAKSSYNQFNDFVVYRYATGEINPDLTPYAATRDTFFNDTIRKPECLGSPPPYDTTQLTFFDQKWTYRVAIRTLSLAQGLTYTAANVYAIDFQRTLTLFDRAYQPAYLHKAITIRLTPSPWYGPSPACEWSINGGAFTKAGPEMAVVPQKVLDLIVARISGVNGRTLTDTMWLTSGLVWEKTGGAFLTHDTTWVCVDGNSVWLGELNHDKVSIWKSQDCLTWQKLTDTVPFQMFYNSSSYISSVVAYKSQIWAFDTHGKLQTSADGVTWSQVGTKTFEGMNSVIPLASARDTLFAINREYTAGSSGMMDFRALSSVDGVTWQEMPKKQLFLEVDKEPFMVDDTLWMFGYSSYSGSSFTMFKTSDFRNFRTAPVIATGSFQNNYRWTHFMGTVIGLGETSFQIQNISSPLIPLPIRAPEGMTYSACIEFKGRLYNICSKGIFAVK